VGHVAELGLRLARVERDRAQRDAHRLGRDAWRALDHLAFEPFVGDADGEGQVIQRTPRVSAEAVRIALRAIPLDTRKAEAELGYVPHPIDDALADALAWLTRREVVETVRPRVSA
jgi:nucleoside-diphosphate-sugar epimerase